MSAVVLLACTKPADAHQSVQRASWTVAVAVAVPGAAAEVEVGVGPDAEAVTAVEAVTVGEDPTTLHTKSAVASHTTVVQSWVAFSCLIASTALEADPLGLYP